MQKYEILHRKLSALLTDEEDFFANAANFCAFLYENLTDINWVGFYLFDGKELVLGPFMGRPACVRIALGRGVCGTSALKRETIIVADVHQYDGHIACDSASKSEIVIPMIYQDTLYGVLDMDSPSISRFTEKDGDGLSELLSILINFSDLKKLKNYYNA